MQFLSVAGPGVICRLDWAGCHDDCLTLLGNGCSLFAEISLGSIYCSAYTLLFRENVLPTHGCWFPRESLHRDLDGHYGASYELASKVP